MNLKEWMKLKWGLRGNTINDSEKSNDSENKRKDYLERNLQEARIAHCLLLYSTNVADKKTFIHIEKPDDNDCKEDAEDYYVKNKKRGYNVILLNYQNNTYKHWNPITKTEKEGEITEVDYDSLIDAIKDIQNDGNTAYVRKGRLVKFYYGIVFELLKEGIFGTKNNDMSEQDFVTLMKNNGLYPGVRQNLSDHLRKLQGKYPKIKVHIVESGKSKELDNRYIDDFISDIIAKYSNRSGKSILKYFLTGEVET